MLERSTDGPADDAENRVLLIVFFFFKQKTAYDIGWCDWSSDVCSSDLPLTAPELVSAPAVAGDGDRGEEGDQPGAPQQRNDDVVAGALGEQGPARVAEDERPDGVHHRG